MNKSIIAGIITAALLLCAVGLGIIWPKQLGHACAAPHVTEHPSQIRFNDTLQNTSLIVQTDTKAKDAGAFTYIIPAGTRYAGGPVQGLQSAGSSSSPFTCAGLLQLSYRGSAQVSSPAQTARSANSALVQLSALIDLTHLGATITFSDLSANQTYSTSTQPPPDMSAATQRYNHVATQRDWSSLYQMTAKADLVGVSESQFAQLMAQQVQQVGTVTSVTPLSAPHIGSTPIGIIFYTIDESIVMTKSSQSRTIRVTSVFILEDGVWKYWFAKPAE